MFNSLGSYSLRNIVLLDAATCVGMGAALTLAAAPIASVTAIPVGLLFYAGLSLFPIAAFMLVSANLARNWPSALWLIIAGNVAWAGASFMLLIGDWIEPNALGFTAVAAQALAVAAFAAVEFAALNRTRPSYA